VSSLYQIGSELAKILDSIDDETGEIPAIDESLLEGLEQERAVKVGNYIRLINTLGMEEEECKRMSDLYAKKRKTRQALIDRLKKNLIEHMKLTATDRIKCDDGQEVKLVNSGGLAPIWIDDTIPPESLPNCYTRFKAEYVIDKEKIRKALESGEELLYARFLPREMRLKIS